MKKKILTAILSGLLIATLAGCGNKLPEKDMPESMALADTVSVTGRETGADSSSAPETSSEPETKPQAEKEEKTKPVQTDTSSAAETAPPKTDTPKPTESHKQAETPKPTEQPKETEPPKADTPPETEEPAPPPTVEEPAFDIGYWISYAQSYAQNIGLRLESSAVDCWDNPITAGAHSLYLERDIQSRLNRYAKDEDITDVWIWSESIGNGEYNIYIGYA